MSLLGITFPNQKVTPSDDALLRQAALEDGILCGCSLQYAGFTLSMAAGHLLLCGREIQNTALASWAVDGSTSGYARLVLTIDQSKTSTAEVFEQIEAAIEYASTPDGFSALEQSEINVSGVRYQAEICVVSLSSGGITGIVRQLPGVTLRADPEFLARLLSAGYMQLSGYQIIEALPDAEAVAAMPEGALLVMPIVQVS